MAVDPIAKAVLRRLEARASPSRLDRALRCLTVSARGPPSAATNTALVSFTRRWRSALRPPLSAYRCQSTLRALCTALTARATGGGAGHVRGQPRACSVHAHSAGATRARMHAPAAALRRARAPRAVRARARSPASAPAATARAAHITARDASSHAARRPRPRRSPASGRSVDLAATTARAPTEPSEVRCPHRAEVRPAPPRQPTTPLLWSVARSRRRHGGAARARACSHSGPAKAACCITCGAFTSLTRAARRPPGASHAASATFGAHYPARAPSNSTRSCAGFAWLPCERRGAPQ